MLGLLTMRKLLQLRKPSKGNDQRKGVTSIEFALIAPAFFMLLIGITELSLVMLAEHLLENATYNASRTSKTGFVAEGKTQLETVRDVMFQRLSGLAPLINTNDLQISFMSYGNLSDIGQPEQGSETVGTASQIVVYTVAYPWKLFTPMMGTAFGNEDGELILTSRIVVRNEPYED